VAAPSRPLFHTEKNTRAFKINGIAKQGERGQLPVKNRKLAKSKCGIIPKMQKKELCLVH
jgi:hypothetical protein